MEAFVRQCRQIGLRVTPQRAEIYREIAGSDEHPGAEIIHERVRAHMPGISLDTVYRTLATLEQYGIITRVQMPSDHARFDANTEPHHHFVCVECGLIRDFISDQIDACEVPAAVRQWGEVRQCRMEIRGVCTACLRKTRAKA